MIVFVLTYFNFIPRHYDVETVFKIVLNSGVFVKYIDDRPGLELVQSEYLVISTFGFVNRTIQRPYIMVTLTTTQGYDTVAIYETYTTNIVPLSH